MNTLKFVQNQSIVEFKLQNNVNTLDVIKSPKTSKLFWKCGSAQGPVANEFDSSKPAQMVLCNDGDEQFWMLCNQNMENVVATL